MVILTLEFILGFTLGLSIVTCSIVIYKSLGGILDEYRR